MLTQHATAAAAFEASHPRIPRKLISQGLTKLAMTHRDEIRRQVVVQMGN